MKCKCGCENFYIEKHGNNTGLYCKDCGKWQKWLNKDETRAFKHQNNNDSKLRSSIENFRDLLDKEIDRQLEREPLSLEDNITKCTYAFAYQKVLNSLNDILNGKEVQ